MGGEFGQFIEWRYKYGLDWLLLEYALHRQMQDCVRDLNAMVCTEKALYELDSSFDGFEWVDCDDVEHSLLTFLRKGQDWRDMLMILCNFSTTGFDGYRVGAPLDTTYTEVLNTDDEKYGGSGFCNREPLTADKTPWQRKPFSLVVKIPPLSTLILRPDTSKYRLKQIGK